MTESELLTMMIGGMAHIAGGVLAIYVGMLGGTDPEQQAFYAKHLLAASIMAAPATLVIAKILIPETGDAADPRHGQDGSREDHQQRHRRRRRRRRRRPEAGAEHRRDAAGLHRPDRDGHHRAADLVRRSHRLCDGVVAGQAADLATLLGYVLAPIAWVIGMPWEDAVIPVGSLIGQKVVLNEFIAYTAAGASVNGDVPGVIS
jgi:CNT family concentrative nucleoside transporter